jgi:hypothetical protein
MEGAGWGDRIFRIRWGSTLLNGSSFTIQDVQNWLAQLPPLDHANRFTDGEPGVKSYQSASSMIDAINGIMPMMRTHGLDHAVSHRLAWNDLSLNGTNVPAFLNAAQQAYTQVCSQTNPPQKALSIDQAGKLSTSLTQQQMDAASVALFKQGWKYVAWGADLNPAAGSHDANFGMLSNNPLTLQINQTLLQQAVSWNYLSISSHIDEPTNFQQWLQNYPTLAQQETAFRTIFKNAIVPATLQLVQGNLYNAVTGQASNNTTKTTYPYPTLSFFASLIGGSTGPAPTSIKLTIKQV